MKKHQRAAIVVGVILTLVSFLPVIISSQAGYELAHPKVVKVFLFPTIGVSIAAIIVFISFFKDGKD